MRNLLTLVFAGMIGGLLTLGGFYLLTSPLANAPQAKQVNFPVAINTPAYAASLDFTNAASKTMPTVVHIKASQGPNKKPKSRRGDDLGSLFEDLFGGGFGMPKGEKKGAGSGVIMSQDGYIVTNNHVVDFADEVEVTLHDDRTFKATKIGVDKRTDIAVLKIDATNLPTIQFGDSDRSKVGEWVLAVGNPFDLTSTVTAGIISAKGRDIDIIRERGAIEDFIQTDAAINPGNSGGALVDLDGKLIGINTAIYSPGFSGTFTGYAFAIPSNMVQEIANSIIENGGSLEPIGDEPNGPRGTLEPIGDEPNGPRGTLGIIVMDVNQELATERNLSVISGVYIEELTDGGAAQYAGLLPNDVIIRVGDQRVKNADQLIEIVNKTKIGEILELTINRNGRTKKFPVALKAG